VDVVEDPSLNVETPLLLLLLRCHRLLMMMFAGW
jgi:hypothetical protein